MYILYGFHSQIEPFKERQWSVKNPHFLTVKLVNDSTGEFPYALDVRSLINDCREKQKTKNRFAPRYSTVTNIQFRKFELTILEVGFERFDLAQIWLCRIAAPNSGYGIEERDARFDPQ